MRAVPWNTACPDKKAPAGGAARGATIDPARPVTALLNLIGSAPLRGGDGKRKRMAPNSSWRRPATLYCVNRFLWIKVPARPRRGGGSRLGGDSLWSHWDSAWELGSRETFAPELEPAWSGLLGVVPIREWAGSWEATQFRFCFSILHAFKVALWHCIKGLMTSILSPVTGKRKIILASRHCQNLLAPSHIRFSWNSFGVRQKYLE